MKITNKKGRKTKNIILVNTEAKINGEWVKIGMSSLPTFGITKKENYGYYTRLNQEYRFEA